MKITLYCDEAGEWRWRWVARNGRIIAVSGEGYTELRWAVRGLVAVVRPDFNAAARRVVERSWLDYLHADGFVESLQVRVEVQR